MDSLEDHINVPSSCIVWEVGHENNGKVKKTKQVQPRKKAPHRKYSVVEDMMIMRGIEACGREWRSVLQFMKDHADILGEAGTVYKMARSDDKLMHDRLRKRANMIMQNPKSDAR